jgi:hypothetical protein
MVDLGCAEPARWFHHWDQDGDSTLDVGEVLRALSKTFTRCSTSELHSVLSALWPIIDPDLR